MNFQACKRGLITGLFLQLAIGPVFFYIINLTLQRTIFDGLIAALAATIADYFYITLSIIGIGKILQKKKFNKIFVIISSTILIIFGALIIRNAIIGLTTSIEINSSNLLSSFVSVLILTLSSPLTIVFFTGLFTAKAIEYKYTKNQLYLFGLAVGSATLLFMGTSVIIFSLLKETIPLIVIQSLNIIVGIVLIGYGLIRIIKTYTPQQQ